jgi:signal transduction histidine kinase
MRNVDVLEILKKFAALTENYQDKEKITNLVIKLITEELKFSLAGVFSVKDHYAGNVNVSSSNFFLEKVASILGTSFQSLTFDINHPDSIFNKAYREKKYQITEDVTPFTYGLNYNIKNLAGSFQTIKRLYGMKDLGLFPCFYKGNIKGFFAVGHPVKFTQEEIDILKVVANQLASYLSFADLTVDLENQNLKLEEELRKEKDMMDILGHELRTPLSIARNAAVMIEMTLKNDPENFSSKMKLKDNNDKVVENLRREVKILETVLSSTQIDNDRLSLVLEPVDCIDVVNDSIEGLKDGAIRKNLELKTEFPPELVYCLADRDQIQRIIDNLIDNAIKYTHKGSVIVRVERVQDQIKFTILDTGEGIPAEDIPKLGKKFFRSRMYLKTSEDNKMQVVRPGGTGIGLNVVFNLVRLMNGRLEIQSEVDKGSVFTVYMPATESAVTFESSFKQK